jgi:DNA-binding transcriptional LysR family regulator
MADLDNILIFAKVAQFESISRAARSLGMPISTVSRRLSVLESELGVSLLRRTTRQITLTARLQFSQQLRVSGHGVGLLPSTYRDEALARGELIRLLPKWASPQIPVFAVYPSRKFLPLRLSVFLKALSAWKSQLWIRD